MLISKAIIKERVYVLLKQILPGLLPYSILSIISTLISPKLYFTIQPSYVSFLFTAKSLLRVICIICLPFLTPQSTSICLASPSLQKQFRKATMTFLSEHAMGIYHPSSYLNSLQYLTLLSNPSFKTLSLVSVTSHSS